MQGRSIFGKQLSDMAENRTPVGIFGACSACRNRGVQAPKTHLYFKELVKYTNSEMLDGARGRNRTTDTRIFSPLLYP